MYKKQYILFLISCFSFVYGASDLDKGYLLIENQGLQVYYGSKEWALVHLDEIAALQKNVMQEYPYLYLLDEHSLYKLKEHLKQYCDSKNTDIFFIFDQGILVGFVGFIPFKEIDDYVRELFKGFDIILSMYLGDLLLLPQYANKQLVSNICQQEFQIAQKKKCRSIICAQIVRSDNCLARPLTYQPFDSELAQVGFKRHKEIINASWIQVYTQKRESNRLGVWIKTI